MGVDGHDREIIRLLAQVKGAEPDYPKHLLAARREQYLRQMGRASLGVAVGMAAKEALKSAKPPVASNLTSKLIEAALVVAIVAEAGAVAYLSRDKLSNFLQSFATSENGPETIASPGVTTFQSQPTATPSPGMSATVALSPTAGIAATPTFVIILLDATDPASTTTVTEMVSTPIPNGDNGHHYGQTPKPERTKENGNDDQPPQNPRPTKKPKPTKSK